MDREYTYMNICYRLLNYIATKPSPLIITFEDSVFDAKTLRIKYKQPTNHPGVPLYDLGAVYTSFSYKSLYEKLLNGIVDISFITKDSSLEEVDLKLSIRGY